MKSEGAARLALTGDAEFVRDMRVRAERLGMRLNEFGLWKWNPPDESPNEQGSGFWELIRATTEEEILNMLGLEFIEPSKRNFAFLGVRGSKARRIEV